MENLRIDRRILSPMLPIQLPALHTAHLTLDSGYRQSPSRAASNLPAVDQSHPHWVRWLQSTYKNSFELNSTWHKFVKACNSGSAMAGSFNTASLPAACLAASSPAAAALAAAATSARRAVRCSI